MGCDYRVEICGFKFDPRSRRLLAFCASDKASYRTGIDVPCDGGVACSVTLRDKLSIAREPS